MPSLDALNFLGKRMDGISNLFESGETPILNGPVFNDVSYTSAVESLYSVLEGYLQPYRDRMTADARGEKVTTTYPGET